MIIYHTVLFDANVLYPASMRDVLMQFAAADLFKAKWSADIHRDPVLLVRTRELVVGYHFISNRNGVFFPYYFSTELLGN